MTFVLDLVTFDPLINFSVSPKSLGRFSTLKCLANLQEKLLIGGLFSNVSKRGLVIWFETILKLVGYKLDFVFFFGNLLQNKSSIKLNKGAWNK